MSTVIFTVGDKVYKVYEGTRFFRENDTVSSKIEVYTKEINSYQDKKNIIREISKHEKKIQIENSIAFYNMIIGSIIVIIGFSFAFGITGTVIGSLCALLFFMFAQTIPFDPALHIRKNEPIQNEFYKKVKNSINNRKKEPAFLTVPNDTFFGREFFSTSFKIKTSEKYFSGFNDVLKSCTSEEREKIARVFDILSSHDLFEEEREKLEQALQNYVDAHTSYIATRQETLPRIHAEEIEEILADSQVQKDIQKETYHNFN